MTERSPFPNPNPGVPRFPTQTRAFPVTNPNPGVEILGVESDHPEWIMDGMSLLPCVFWPGRRDEGYGIVRISAMKLI